MKTSNQNAFALWQAYAKSIRRRADALTNRIHDRGFAIAATVGIPRDLCCLHNASIDEDLRGWCKDAPERLAVAKRAVRIIDDWSASRLAEVLISRAYNRILAPVGYAPCPIADNRPRPTINHHLLFANV